MGKKACLALDLEYDCVEVYDVGYDVLDDDDGAGNQRDASSKLKSNSCKMNNPLCKSSSSKEVVCKSPPPPLRTANSSSPNPLKVIKPSSKYIMMSSSTKQDNNNSSQPQKQILHYVPNPQRRPLFTEHIATANDGLLYNVVAYLDIRSVIQLSMVSKLIHESLSVDGLYCNDGSKSYHLGASNNGKEENVGILLPCLWEVRHRLLPVLLDNNHDDSSGQGSSIGCRPRGISRLFAYECLAFSKSCKGNVVQDDSSESSIRHSSHPVSITFQPKTIFSMNTPEQVNTISFRYIQWEQQSIKKSGVRLSYVQSENNNCALMTIWIGNNHCINDDKDKPYTKERYLPPNTEKIIDASIHSDLCVILATPVDCSKKSYILSLVTLPNMPPTSKCNQSSKNVLKWQKLLPSKNWQLFSSSEILPIISFINKGTHVIFGSTERWGIVDCETGSQLWTSFDVRKDDAIMDVPSSLQMKPMFPATSYTNASRVDKYQNKAKTTTSIINAILMHHEFLFTLENNGSLMRVYDVTNTCSNEPLAEGSLPWTSTRRARGRVNFGPYDAHHTTMHHRELVRNEFRMAFCAGRIWITGMYNSDLLCSSPPRLLRRLRSRLPTVSSSSRCSDVLSLRFVRMKTDLQPNAPHPMHTWNDTHLYIVDAKQIYCWRSNNGKSGSFSADQVKTIYNAGVYEYIEKIYVDGTKVIVCTNATFWNTTARCWDGSGNVRVLPVDVSATNAHPVPSDLVLPTRTNRLDSPPLQVYHKKLFNVKQFSGIVANNGIRLDNVFSQYPISTSSNSNYKLVDMSSDGRYVLVSCEKGMSTKTVILDLYRQDE